MYVLLTCRLFTYVGVQASHPGYELNVGMKLFVDKTATPKKNFKDAISKVYNATIDTIDFSNTTSAVAKINEWSKAVTKGHIEHLLSEGKVK